MFPAPLQSGSQFNASFGTVEATPGTVMSRDENGRGKISAPEEAADIANKGYVDGAVEGIAEAAAEYADTKLDAGVFDTWRTDQWPYKEVGRITGAGSWVIGPLIVGKPVIFFTVKFGGSGNQYSIITTQSGLIAAAPITLGSRGSDFIPLTETLVAAATTATLSVSVAAGNITIAAYN